MANRARARLLTGASFVALTLAGGAAAQAPAAPAAQPGVEEVVVTGTRLSSGFTTPTPVTALTAEVIQQKAPTQILEVIYDIPGVRMDAGPTQALRQGPGSGNTATVNLRGLGSNRTLVLVDGHRQVPTGPGGTFDSNRIPVSLVERVDVVTGGASAAYGSDAVAGVVNFIINDRLEGQRASVQYGISQENDNRSWTASFAAGGRLLRNDRAHFLFGFDYTDGDGVDPLYSRDWGREEPGLLAYPAGRPAGTPAQVWAKGVQLSSVTRGGIITSGPLRGIAFNDSGQPYNFQYGTVVGAGMTGTNANYGYNPLGHFPLVQAVERGTAMGRLTYELTPNVTLYGDLSYTLVHTNGASGLTQAPAVIISIANPYIPAAVRAQMVANNLQTITLGWTGDALNVRGTGPAYGSDNNNYITQINTGARGTLFGSWKWDINYAKGVSRIDNTSLSKPHYPNFYAAVNAVTNAAGQIVCGPVATNPNLSAAQRPLVEPGCVPYNIFGVNSASEAARAYAGRQSHSLQIARQDAVSANLAGEPFSTWAGPVSFAIGGEYRHEAISVFGEGYDSTVFNFGGTTTYTGRQNIAEAYVEAGIPLLKDVAVAKALDINAAFRRTHYGISGDVDTWKVGLTYDVNDDVRFRATRSRDIRAPNLSELYNVGAKGTANNQRNPFNNQTGQLFSLGGGNLDLKPEIGDTVTAGIVLQPKWDWAAGFRASIDYYKIEIDGVVASVGTTDIVNRCFQGIQSYCSAITFDNSPFGIALVRTSTYNLNKLETSGVDIEVSYRVPLDRLPGALPGVLDIRALGNHTDVLTTTDVTGIGVNRAGTGAGVPEWTWNLVFSYKLDRLAAQLRAHHFTELIADTNAVGPDDASYNPAAANSISKNLFPAATYWNLAAQYELGDKAGYGFQVFGSIDNLLNTRPPEYAPIAFSNSSVAYDLIGRQFRIGLRMVR